jgi:hypothetical protein
MDSGSQPFLPSKIANHPVGKDKHHGKEHKIPATPVKFRQVFIDDHIYPCPFLPDSSGDQLDHRSRRILQRATGHRRRQLFPFPVKLGHFGLQSGSRGLLLG